MLGGASLLVASVLARARFARRNDNCVSTSAWLNYSRILSDRAFLYPALTGGLGYGVIIAFNTAAPAILQGALGWSVAEYGLLGWPISIAYLLGALGVNHYVLRAGQCLLMTVGVGLVFTGSLAMLLGSIAAPSIALLFWLPYCVAVFGQAINYPISLSLANDGSPVGGAYAMALSGFIHQLMAAAIGGIASVLVSQQAWPLSLLCLLLAALAMLGAFLASSRKPQLAS